MNTWSPIWSGIVDSSIWEEPPDVVKVFVTILATKDSDHICRLDSYKIARKCVLDEVRVLEILHLLASPDKRRKGRQEFDGRRIKSVKDGWFVLNGEKYREMVQYEMKRSRDRKAQAVARLKKKLEKQKVKPLNGEVAAEQKLKAGEITQDQFDDRAAETREHPDD